MDDRRDPNIKDSCEQFIQLLSLDIIAESPRAVQTSSGLSIVLHLLESISENPNILTPVPQHIV
jgi:hypothetical protein